MGAVTPGGLVWGMAPGGQLASFDGQSWTDAGSWRLYDPPGGVQEHVVPLAVAPDGGLWLAIGDAVGRFDPGSAPDEAWTLYSQEDGLPASYHRAMAFGPGGEVWFGTTRFEPGLTDASTEGDSNGP